MSKFITSFVFIVAITISLAAQNGPTTVELKNGQGQPVGKAVLTAAKDGGVTVALDLNGFNQRVAALTTTGFGDITLPGTLGRLISIIIMIFGVTLFFGLARAVLVPDKVRFRCPKCALLRHDRDAVHCKACGGVLNIPNDGLGD